MIVTNPKFSERHSAKLEVELINTIASVKNIFLIKYKKIINAF